MWQSIYIMAKSTIEGFSLSGTKVTATARKKALETVRAIRDNYAGLGASGRGAVDKIDAWLAEHVTKK
jgi:hypothetical protein